MHQRAPLLKNAAVTHMDDIYDRSTNMPMWWDMRDEVRSDEVYSASDLDSVFANGFWGEYSMSTSCD
jgi:hypothetical protein